MKKGRGEEEWVNERRMKRGHRCCSYHRLDKGRCNLRRGGYRNWAAQAPAGLPSSISITPASGKVNPLDMLPCIMQGDTRRFMARHATQCKSLPPQIQVPAALPVRVVIARELTPDHPRHSVSREIRDDLTFENFPVTGFYH